MARVCEPDTTLPNLVNLIIQKGFGSWFVVSLAYEIGIGSNTTTNLVPLDMLLYVALAWVCEHNTLPNLVSLTQKGLRSWFVGSLANEMGVGSNIFSCFQT